MRAAFSPFEGTRFTFHTNHPRVNDDLKQSFAESPRSPGRTIEEYGAMCPRFAFLRRILNDNKAGIDLSRLKDILDDRASRINNALTYGCTIMVLGEKPELHISAGRTDEASFQVLTFSSGPDL